MTSAQAFMQQPPASTQFNPLQFAHNMAESAKIWQETLKIIAQEDAFSDVRSGDMNLAHLAQDYCHWMNKVLQDPSRLMQLGYVWWADSTTLWQQTIQRFLDADSTAGTQQSSNVNALSDKRFSGEAWQNNIFFDYIKNHYLMTSSWMQDAVQKLDDDLDPHTQEKLYFYTKQWIDAIAPSNFLITNPEVLKAALESNGETVLKGLQNLKEDFERGKGRLAISTTDNTAFEVGKNLAATKGSVIYQNELMQLIQYAPTTEQVKEIPVLLIPAWINKYYIFDMQEKNSFVKWLLDKGYTVFVISWVNPDARHRYLNFADYMSKGVLHAIDIVREICDVSQVNCAGYCLGGTLLATSLAYLHAKGEQEKVATATYFTTMIDFAEPGELGVFIDENQIQAIEAKMEKKGYLDGADMATTFSLLRSNNMIWSFVINNYLLGKEPFPFDLLYWNSDSTRMPATMHSFCLRNMYQENKLVQQDALELNGVKIDIRRITTPSYILSTREDHIAPWQSTFAATHYYSGDIDFVLAGSGHIAGVINPPDKQKYSYWTNPTTKNMHPDVWLNNAEEHQGSWWDNWHSWQQSRHSNKLVPARKVGSTRYKQIEAAPGSYVKVR